VKYWMYKCSTSARTGQNSGDWERVFAGDARLWGEPSKIPTLDDLRSGHLLLAYQSNRNELVGVARVLGFERYRGSRHVKVVPVERIGVKVRPLKKQYSRIGALGALRQGPVQTLYEVATSDAEFLLRVARAATSADPRSQSESKGKFGSSDGADSVTQYLRESQGFEVDPAVRKVIEAAAVQRARHHYERVGFRVIERGKPFDLECRRGSTTLFVEVKGTQTKGTKIFLTPNEVDFAHDNRMELFVVHSMTVVHGEKGPRVRGGVDKRFPRWRPRRARLVPVIYSYLVDASV
jgi:Protein NO VEIN, C-terminal